MSSEILLRNSFFTTSEIWIAVAYLVCMFTVVSFRPQQIGNDASFRLSYILFVLYFILPSSLGSLFSLTLLTGHESSGKTGVFVFQLLFIFARFLLGLSILFGLGSLRRTPVTESASVGD